MPIQLDKILGDIAEERVLHPVYAGTVSKKDTEDAWSRVGKKNKLSVHEARSIFKVLQKKYEQEKVKDSSSWKLFSVMEDIHKKMEDTKPEVGDSSPLEEEEFIEMLEVHEEDDIDTDDTAATTNSADKEQKSDTGAQKILNPKTTPTGTPKQGSSDGATILHKMGLIVKKTVASSSPLTSTSSTKTAVSQGLHNALAAAVKASSRPSSRASTVNELKRKSSSDPTTNSVTVKKPSLSSTITQFPVVEIKQEADETTASSSTHPKINVITIPGNPNTTEISNGGFGLPTASSTNGFSPRIEDIDFRNDIIFDSGSSASVGNAAAKNAATDIINIGNFDNHLPPTFFKNLCNSNRHESLGLYVANVMNRVSSRAAAKLELNILRAIIEAKSDEMEQ